jgi:hypothetical protein
MRARRKLRLLQRRPMGSKVADVEGQRQRAGTGRH